MAFTEALFILFISLSLSADCFAVAVGGSVSISKLRFIQAFRTALVFGIAQALMAIAGWFLGRTVIDIISNFDHWVIFGLLSIVGGHMIWEAFREGEEGREGSDISRGVLLFTLAIATSLDSLAIGLSFGLQDTNIITVSLIIGFVSFILTNLGFYIGHTAKSILGQRVKILGGVILIGIGIKEIVSYFIG